MINIVGPPPTKLTLIRIFNAPRELVFKAWTDPKMMNHWWGPHVFTSRDAELDPKPGGIFKVCMEAPEFPSHWTIGKYEEIIVPEKIVFTTSAFVDDRGEPGITVVTTVLFEEDKKKTKLTLNADVIKHKPELEFALRGMEQGWSESLEKLGTLLSKSN
jgi:uncharacterized protein YndB with AHSA1/START domain